ncbi:DUF58 domain-containing protein [Desulfobacter hydrogenophilus]|uniref:DUF58 domain-containing protein n=1 Tax=Desulfobacter hydrogenophilus TaxID=2291 RepID=A0A328FEN2_9BACT|nr:DUF58 domain-containing protein [Desulfobacter hydrogenophilus]NDY71292.1 DUF58 domain-containing protein [Desulfobacter hydrogenophilus]QBH14974.1 DUF58 domain-containing protein [Desulfobacter hydrogenophilus]RAM02779.1 DUF58 domain-containing protein [Desulfobacter hydrogenophilus]
MIPAHIIRKIKQIHIKSRKTVNTLMAGQYRSVFKGSGIEFEEVREYAPGDDVKSIDWNVSARTGKVFVKLFREERESIVMLLIDMSASLNFGTHSGSKLEKVAELASVLAFNAIKNNDKVGVIFFTDQVEKYIPPKKGSAHVWRVIKEIFTFAPEGVGTDIACVLDFMAKISKKRSFAFVISDYLSPEYEKSLRLLNRRHEVVGMRVFDDGAFHLPSAGIVRVKDFETGEETLMDAGSKKIRQWYTDQRQKIHTLTESVFSKSRVDLVDVTTADSVSDVLTRYFMLRESRR